MMTDKRMRRGAANISLFAAMVVFALAAGTLIGGGVTWRAVGLSSRDPWRPLVGGLVLLAVARSVTGGAEFRRALSRYTGTAATWPSRVAAVAAACVLVFGLAWSSRAAGGSDSSCYVLQAEAFAHGHATLVNPAAQLLPDTPNAVFAPTGFVPGREHGHAVPICAPGLALAMAGVYLFRPAAVFLVVPISAALLVWLTFLYGRRLDDAVTGASAAVLAACSPILLYQAVQPMSDVPAAAAWLAALVSTSPFAAGAWMSVAILTRPNLILLAPLLALSAMRERRARRAGQGDTRQTALIAFATGMVPGFLVLLALNAARYGSPLATGYGSTEALFARAHVYANLLRYLRWVLETETPLVLLALGAPFVLRRDPARARLAWVSLAATALLLATYFAYTVFDDWWYIRFLLPAIPLLLALSLAVLRRLTSGLPDAAAQVALVMAVALLAVDGVHVARGRHAMELQTLESRFVLTGEYAARMLPANAVVVAGQQSGSIRFHGHRETIAWDAIAPDQLDATIGMLRQRGGAVYLALEDGEEPAFRRRFSGQEYGSLEWPPQAIVDGPTRVRVFAVSDRASYLSGAQMSSMSSELVRGRKN
jgi:hypothetical protein